jgi:hypothetical protein
MRRWRGSKEKDHVIVAHMVLTATVVNPSKSEVSGDTYCCDGRFFMVLLR